MWKIVNVTDKSLFWSNDFGWVHKGYDAFSAAERASLNLPMEGKWVRFH